MTEEEKKYAFWAYEEYKRQRALEAVFDKQSWCCELKDFNWFLQAFCLFKTWICLKLRRTNGSYLNSDTFCVLAYDERCYMDSTSWDSVWISPHFFKHWNVCLAIDGT